MTASSDNEIRAAVIGKTGKTRFYRKEQSIGRWSWLSSAVSKNCGCSPGGGPNFQFLVNFLWDCDDQLWYF